MDRREVALPESLKELLEREEPTPPRTSMCEISLFFSLVRAKRDWNYYLQHHNRLLLG